MIEQGNNDELTSVVNAGFIIINLKRRNTMVLS